MPFLFFSSCPEPSGPSARAVSQLAEFSARKYMGSWWSKIYMDSTWSKYLLRKEGTWYRGVTRNVKKSPDPEGRGFWKIGNMFGIFLTQGHRWGFWPPFYSLKLWSTYWDTAATGHASTSGMSKKGHRLICSLILEMPNIFPRVDIQNQRLSGKLT